MDLKLKKSIEDYIRWSPISLVVRESCRIYTFQKIIAKYNINSNADILDVGCGDGKWWTCINDQKNFNVYGVDISESEVKKAQAVINAKNCDISKPNSKHVFDLNFDLIIGNCSMEHIPDIDSALANISSICKTNGLFILFVPTPYWAHSGKIIGALDSLSPRFSMCFSGAVNGFFQHWHLYNYKIWNNILKEHGFEVVEVGGIGTSRLEFIFRLFLFSGFVAFIVKKITGRYLNYFLSKLVPDFILKKIASKVYHQVVLCEVDKDSRTAFEYIIVARKK